MEWLNTYEPCDKWGRKVIGWTLDDKGQLVGYNWIGVGSAGSSSDLSALVKNADEAKAAMMSCRIPEESESSRRIRQPCRRC